MATKKPPAWLSVFFIFRRIIDWLVDIIFCYFFSSRLKLKLPPVKEKFMLQSASSIAKAIRNKELSSEKVVSSFIDRIREVNPTLNAVVDERFEAALQEAREVDEFLKNTTLTKDELAEQKPFLGVPFTSKESTAAKGMAFTFSMVSRKGVKATEDADIVTLIKKSGAILMAVTNVPELNLWCETRSNVYGQTLNPYDSSRTPGGSSGGEASIISACGSPMGIGTDVGGSTRMPSYYCGVFGHKPTAGLISTRGMTFRTGEEDHTIVAAGSITRHSEDIIPFMKLLFSNSLSKLKLDQPVDLKTLKCYYVVDPGDMRVSPVSDEVAHVITKAASHLSTISPVVKQVHLDGFRYSQPIWRHWMTREPSNFIVDIGNRETEVCWWKELGKMMMGQCQHTLPVILRLVDLKVLPPTNAEWAEAKTEELLAQLKDLLGDDGVLLFPDCPTTAPYHYASFLRPYNFAYWGIFNALKLPATQVPMGLSKDGLPVGLQVVAGPYNDHLCFAVAAELEKTFGGWVPPFPNK